jgi:LamB/YcsF family
MVTGGTARKYTARRQVTGPKKSIRSKDAPMNLEHIKDLIDLFARSPITGMEVEANGVRLRMKIDINSDLGDGFGAYRIGDDEALLHTISSANVVCGYHAGVPPIMDKTAQLALARAVDPGAPPVERRTRRPPASVRDPCHK